MTDDLGQGQWNLKYICYGPNPCPMCRPWDGHVFRPGSELPLPAHPNCMCGYEPVPPSTPTEEIDWSQVDEDTRHHWILYLAYLLREGLAVPPVLLPLEEEAEAHNRGREEHTSMPDTQSLSDARFVLGSEHLRLTAIGRREYRARLIRAGRIRAQGGEESRLEIPVETLRDALDRGLFNGKPTFVDHPGWLDYPSLRNLARITAALASWDPDDQAVTNTIHLYDNEPGRIIGELFDAILADGQNGQPTPEIGLSAVLWAKWEKADDGEAWRMAASATSKALTSSSSPAPTAGSKKP